MKLSWFRAWQAAAAFAVALAAVVSPRAHAAAPRKFASTTRTTRPKVS